MINPVVEIDKTRKPKAATIFDPGRPGKTYKHSSCIGEENWCLSLVSGTDLSALDNNHEIEHIFGEDIEDGDTTFLATTEGNKFRWEILQEIGRKINPKFTPKGTWVK